MIKCPKCGEECGLKPVTKAYFCLNYESCGWSDDRINPPTADELMRIKFEAWFLNLNSDFGQEELSTMLNGDYFYTTTQALWNQYKTINSTKDVKKDNITSIDFSYDVQTELYNDILNTIRKDKYAGVGVATVVGIIDLIKTQYKEEMPRG